MKIRILIFLFIINTNFCFPQKNINSNSLKVTEKINPKKDTLALKDSLILNRKEPIVIKLVNSQNSDNFKYIFPIITLLLGIGLNKSIDYLNKRKKTKKTGKRWLAELRILNEPIEKQIINIDSFLAIQNNGFFAIHSPSLFTILDCEVFNSLDKTELVEYLEYFKKNKDEIAIKHSNKINGFITVLKNHNENYKIQFELFKNNVNTITDSLSKNLITLQREFVTYGIELEKELNSDPINNQRYKPIYDLFKSEILPYLQDGNYDIFKLENSFFVPLIKIFSELRLDSKTQKMMEYAKNCVNDIKAIKMEQYYLTENFNALKERYTESKNELPNIIKLLE